MGTALWILPRFTTGAPRGDERYSWSAFVLLDAGIWLVVFQPLFPWNLIAVVGRVAESLAVLIFVLSSWKRIKPFGV